MAKKKFNLDKDALYKKLMPSNTAEAGEEAIEGAAASDKNISEASRYVSEQLLSNASAAQEPAPAPAKPQPAATEGTENHSTEMVMESANVQIQSDFAAEPVIDEADTPVLSEETIPHTEDRTAPLEDTENQMDDIFEQNTSCTLDNDAVEEIAEASESEHDASFTEADSSLQSASENTADFSVEPKPEVQIPLPEEDTSLQSASTNTADPSVEPEPEVQIPLPEEDTSLQSASANTADPSVEPEPEVQIPLPEEDTSLQSASDSIPDMPADSNILRTDEESLEEAAENEPISAPKEHILSEQADTSEQTENETAEPHAAEFTTPSVLKHRTELDFKHLSIPMPVNLTEKIVRSHISLILRDHGICTCARCQMDATSIALNKITTKYISWFSSDQALSDFYYKTHFAEIMSAMLLACSIVKNAPRHEEEHQVPEKNLRVHNMIEDLVAGQIKKMLSSYDGCCCDHCLSDIAALMLNHIPAKYTITSEGKLFAKLVLMEQQYHVDMTTQFIKASHIVQTAPNH